MANQDHETGAHPLLPADGRVVAIDIVRGFAILWVILYHLWTDVKFPESPALSDSLRAVPRQLAGGDPWHMLTALGDAFFRAGYLGVPLFMTLSGLSLTLAALGRDDGVVTDVPRFLYRRLRRVMIPYWFGFAYAVTFALALAFEQWQRLGGASYADFVRTGDIKIDARQLFAGAALLPRAWANDLRFAPEGSLWFILPIVQYYLLFPYLMRLMRRIGPWGLLGLTFAVTFVSLNVIVAFDGNLLSADSWVNTLVVFRIFEFGLGMAAGQLMVKRPQFFLEYTRAPLDILSIVVIGSLLFIGGGMIDVYSGDLVIFAGPMLVLGMGLILMPLVMKVPGRLETSAPGRMFAWVGVISYTVLIVNEPLRSVTHLMRFEQAGLGWQVLWIGVVYMPLTLIVARPLAVLLGLVERTPDARDGTVPAASVDSMEPTSLQA